jgi:hypothetical protein
VVHRGDDFLRGLNEDLSDERERQNAMRDIVERYDRREEEEKNDETKSDGSECKDRNNN